MLNTSYSRDLDDSVFLPNSPKVINNDNKSNQIISQTYTEVTVDDNNKNLNSIRIKTKESKQIQVVHKIEKTPTININVAVRNYLAFQIKSVLKFFFSKFKS